jgi:hypothetical protein
LPPPSTNSRSFAAQASFSAPVNSLGGGSLACAAVNSTLIVNDGSGAAKLIIRTT